jgi:ATP-dependent Clp protease ATP-binding subunit ClpA
MSIPFSDETRAALSAAQAEAAATGSPTVESEHILLGVMTRPDTAAARLLAEEFGLTLQSAQQELDALKPKLETPLADPAELSTDAERIVQQAISEARSLGSDAVTPLHLLLGLLRRKHEVSGAALALLEAHTDSVDAITREVRAALHERG